MRRRPRRAARRAACRRRARRRSRGRATPAHSRAAAGDPGRDRPGAEAVVDPDDREAGRARAEHRVERRLPAVRRAVADARRHADHRRRRRGRRRGSRARRPCPRRRRRSRPLEIGQRGREPVDAGDAHVLVHDDGRPEELGADPRLVHDRPVGGAGRHDGDEPARLGDGPRDPDAARAGRPPPRRARRARTAARAASSARVDEHAAGPPSSSAARSPRPAPASSLGEHGLGSALPELAVDVDPREAEIAVRKLGEPLERVVRAHLPARTASSSSRRSSRSPATGR